jgi:selenocysteine lyase/cysteine desulfurase
MGFTRRQFLWGSGLTATSLGLGRGAWAGAAAAATPAAKAAAAAPPATLELRPDDWASVRAQFNLAPGYAHLSSFYIASHPAPVRAAIETYRRALDENPFNYVEGHMFEEEADMLWRAVTAAAAEYIGGAPEEVALTSNTTMGLALLYNGLRLKPGQEILTTVHDHYSHHESIRLAVEKSGGTVRKVTLYDTGAAASADEIVSRLAAAITPKVRLVGVTWVHSSTGVRLPIRRMAEAIAKINSGRADADRALLIVDGVHGFGAVDERVASLGCDFFASGTHKWIFAPRGTGLVWARAANWAQVTPTIPTFTGLESYLAWQDGHPPAGPTTAAQVSPGGFVAFEHQWAAVEAFRFHGRIGRARIAERIATLNARIKDGLAAMPHVTLLTPRDPALSAGINAFEVRDRTPKEVVRSLLARRVVASESPYKPTLPRLAAGIMNTPEEVDTALAAVRALA